MLINESPNYVKFLKAIAKDIMHNQVRSLLTGRDGIKKYWIDAFVETGKGIGPKSRVILSNDLDAILDHALGTDF